MKNNKSFAGTIEGTGHGEVSAAPDEAIVMLDVLTHAKTAASAVSANAKRTQAVIDAVEQEPNHGVTTTGLGVYPVYSYDAESNTSKITGYRATNGVRVLTKPQSAGRVYDAGIDAGANVSSGISYEIADEAPLRAEALRLAVEKATMEATIVAKAIALSVAKVEVLGPDEIVIDPEVRPILYRADRFAAEAAPTPVMPDDLTIEANVRIRFRIEVTPNS